MSEKKQRELRVRCLVLDHDDTVVKSTPEINFPAFLRSLKDLRGTTMSYEQFVEYNFDPGFYEEMVVTVVKEGKELNQGVAYLDDGTMIVVENGRNYMNETIHVAVTRVIQTNAGRMIFARPHD